MESITGEDATPSGSYKIKSYFL